MATSVDTSVGTSVGVASDNVTPEWSDLGPSDTFTEYSYVISFLIIF